MVQKKEKEEEEEEEDEEDDSEAQQLGGWKQLVDERDQKMKARLTGSLR